MAYSYNNIFSPSTQQFKLSSTYDQPPSSIFTETYDHIPPLMSLSFPPNLLSPNLLEYDSRVEDSRIRHSSSSSQQPITNPHERFLMRNETNCPTHLTGKKRTKWLKAGRKAQENQRLINTLSPFSWPESNYDAPLYIHHRVSESHLLRIMSKIAHVHLFTIDTESNKPTRQNPNSIPALIQVQAIHDNTYSTIILIEAQYLPHSSTPLFHSIQQLCRMIFSSRNTIMAWGNVQDELRPFEHFNLFDLSEVTNVVNLQQDFTLDWNKTHPHTPECLDRHQPIADEYSSDDILVCLVNSDDLEDDFDPSTPIEDYQSCLCPSTIRPYKMKNAIWSLQNAVEHVFHQALDKSMTLNHWTCGLDLHLRTWLSDDDKHTRQSLVSYAINDLFASTNLYYYLNQSRSTSTSMNTSTSTELSQLNTIRQRDSSHAVKSIFLLSDSHGKNFSPTVVTPRYKLTTKAISGLSWNNQYDSRLCAKSLISSPSISSILSQSNSVVFFIGTNSIRTTYAPRILEQINEIIDLIRFQHPHLIHTTDITIISAFPCFKTSSLFTSTSALLSNIYHYNELLKNLSFSKHFAVIDLPITADHLHTDGMHVQVKHLPLLFDTIQLHLDQSIGLIDVSISSRGHRSHAAIQRRNQRRHEKQKQRQAEFIVIRPIARVWKLNDIKSYLKHKEIRFNRLPEIRNHKLRIQFNTSTRQQQAEATLTSTDFNESNYYNWISRDL